MHARDIVALVTGANRGIGRAIVQEFVSAGARHVYAASRTPLDYDAGEHVTEVRLDVTKASTIEAAAARCADVNVVVNNAGVLLGQSLLGAPNHDAAEAEMRVNYFGTLQMCRTFAPVLAHNGGGAIVNVLSILSRVNLPMVGSYSASKAAALSLTNSRRTRTPRNHGHRGHACFRRHRDGEPRHDAEAAAESRGRSDPRRAPRRCRRRLSGRCSHRRRRSG